MTVVSCFNYAEAVFFATGCPDARGDLGKLECIQHVSDNDNYYPH